MARDRPGLELRAGAARAVVDPERGGRLASLRIGGVEILGRGVPGGGAPEAWFDGCFPMAPFAGRLTGDRVTCGGVSHALPRPSAGVEAAHGVVDRVPWEVREASPRRVRLRAELARPWPFGGWAEQEIELRETGIELVLRCGNEEREMPVSLGYHPWFAREAAGERARLRFAPEARFAPLAPGLFGEPVPGRTSADASRRTAADASGRAASPDPAPGSRDDSFLHTGDPEIAWGALRVTLVSSSDVWHVFDAQEPAFCVEPLTAAPDGLRPERTRIVGPGAPAELRFALRWDS